MSMVYAQKEDSIYLRTYYDKTEVLIPMRDGVKLFTVVYMPKDQSKKYPILLNRTCYNASVYEDYKTHGHTSNFLVQDKYILAFQDVRGRYGADSEIVLVNPNRLSRG